MHSLYRGMMVGCRVASIILLAALVIILLAGIILREFFSTPLVWAIEISLTLFVWIVFLGAGMAMAEGAHIRLTLLVEKLPASLRGIVALLVSYGGLVLLAVLFWSSIEIAWGFRNNTMTSVRISTVWTWAAAPVGLGFMMLAWMYARPWSWQASLNELDRSGEQPTGTQPVGHQVITKPHDSGDDRRTPK